MGRQLEFGYVLPMQMGRDGEKPTWAEINAQAKRAVELGFDTVWTVDEIVWRRPTWSGPRGHWECLALTGAVAASTANVQVGTFVVSALQRNPGMVARAAETLDEISNGRFVLGLGAGHVMGGAKEYGYPDDKIVSRYAEALEIIVPLLRGQLVTFHGEFHHADGAEVLPRGPRPGKIPLLLGGQAPRTMKLAAKYADIWSAYAKESNWPEAFVPMIEQLERTCEEIGRDPATLGRSIGIWVAPGDPQVAKVGERSGVMTGSVEQIAEALAGFADIGVTRVEIMGASAMDAMDEVEQLGAAVGAVRKAGVVSFIGEHPGE